MVVSQPANVGADHKAEFLCHASAWFGLVFATPLFVALNNQQDISIPVSWLSTGLFALFILVSFTSWRLAAALPTRSRRLLAVILLALGFTLAIQGNVIHSLTYFGQFDGSRVDFRKYGLLFWIEWYGFVAGFLLLVFILSRFRQLSAWLPWVPILSFSLVLIPAFFANDNQPVGIDSDGHDESVFEFSSNRNLIHLLPDGLQGDIVEQVLRENPELAERFRGFTLYTDHLGLYYGTAPTLPALLTGEPFDFAKGHTFDWITPFIDEYSYQSVLADQGFTLDLVPIADTYCVSGARSCVPRPFSGWKSWGYERYRVNSAVYSLQLMADLTLYRLSPSYLKEKIYAAGEWMLAGSTLGGASPWPDPVIREWVDGMQVAGEKPRYKFYHYIGTHKPPFWNSQCERQSGLARNRESYLAQAHCILQGIAALLDKLEAMGIYDQTAMIISADHGHETVPADVSGSPLSIDLSKEMMGTARPALMVKEMANTAPLKFSQRPTSIVDVAAMARSISGGQKGSQGGLAEGAWAGSFPDRYFHDYPLEKIVRWNSEPIPYDRYRIRGPANEDASWELFNIETDHPAPHQYPVISYESSAAYVRGVMLNPANAGQKEAWIDRKQFAFLISIPRPDQDQPAIVLTLHIPDWIGAQAFSVRVNETGLDETFEVLAGDRFWQEVRIDLPQSALRDGNNFISLHFNRLQTAPQAGNLNAAGFLKSIHVERNVE